MKGRIGAKEIWASVLVSLIGRLVFLDPVTFVSQPGQSAWMMPLIALLSTSLIGWVKSPKCVADGMERGGYKFRRKRMYYVMIRYVAPVMMLVLFLQSTGLLSMIFK